jgi:hypothetical protein
VAARETRGGRRAGAGKPRKYGEKQLTRKVTLTLPEELVADVDREADEESLSRSEIIARDVKAGRARRGAASESAE